MIFWVRALEAFPPVVGRPTGDAVVGDSAEDQELELYDRICYPSRQTCNPGFVDNHGDEEM